MRSLDDDGTDGARNRMSPVNLRQLDLNLLVVFDAVMTERSVTRVAARLAMTQSSVSHALARLRISLQDELFVRAPEGMVPTPFAADLALPVKRALETIERAIADSRRFDAANARRSFVVAVNNQSAVSLVPTLVQAVRKAPRIKLDVRPSGTLDIAERLDTGAVDLAVGGFIATAERFSDRRLFDDDFVVLCRAGHPALVGPTMSVEQLGSFPHLVLSSTGENDAFVDEALARSGYERRIALYAPLLAATDLLSGSDMLAIVARRTGTAIARHGGLGVLDLPFATPRLMTSMLWHRRWDQDGAHTWLRELILEAAGRPTESNRPAPADSSFGPAG